MNVETIRVQIEQKLGHFNYWRNSQNDASSCASCSCQVASCSDPCEAEPTCDLGDGDKEV